MANGFSTERMLEMILEEIQTLTVKVDGVQKEVSNVNANGCAQYANHSRRLDNLETWKDGTTNRFIGMLLAVIGSLGAAIYNLFKP